MKKINPGNEQCDKCLKFVFETILIKWPGLDASVQYQWVCKDCNSEFIKMKNKIRTEVK